MTSIWIALAAVAATLCLTTWLDAADMSACTANHALETCAAAIRR